MAENANIRPTVVVAGFSDFAAALRATGSFAEVFHIDTLRELQPLLQNELKTVDKSKLVYCVAPEVVVDIPRPLGLFVNTLTDRGFEVIVLNTAPDAENILADAPRARAFNAPFTPARLMALLSAAGVANIMPPVVAAVPKADVEVTAPPVSFTAPPSFTPPPVSRPPSREDASRPVAPRPPQLPTAPPRRASLDELVTAESSSGIKPRSGMSEVRSAPKQGFVITIVAPKGGVGKSSMSLNLASTMALALRGTSKKVILVDANFGQPGISKAVNLYEPTIHGLVKSRNLTPQSIARFRARRNDLNLDLLLGPSSTKEASGVWLTPQLYSEIVNNLREMYDYIFIDTQVAEYHAPMIADFVLKVTDFLFTLATPDFESLANAEEFLTAIADPITAGGRDFSHEKIGFFLNQADERGGISVRQAQESLGKWKFLGELPYDFKIRKAINDGEVLAAKGYEDLNWSFKNALFKMTREEAIKPGPNPSLKINDKSSLGDKLGGLFKKNKKL